MSSKTSATTSISSGLTVIVLSLSTLVLLFIPTFFTTFPADLKNLTLFLTSLLVFLFFIITLIRRRQLYLNLSPLTGSLTLLAFLLLFSVLTNTFLYPAASLLSFAGLYLSFVVISIFASHLIKINNNQILTTSLIYLATYTSLLSIIIFANSYFHFLSGDLTSALFQPLLAISLIFLGLSAISAQFFKKNKFKKQQLFFLPVLLAGLFFSFYLHLRQPSTTPSFAESLTVLTNQLTHDSRLHWRTILLGSRAADYQDLYSQYHSDNYDPNTYSQSASTPLTLTSLYGGLVLLAWLFLVIQTTWLCFSPAEKNKHLYFILLTSFIVQLFTPIYPLVLLLQAIIIAFATNKNKKTLFDFNFATILDQKEGQKIQHRDHSFTVRLTLIIVGFVCLIYTTYSLFQVYRAYYHHRLALQAVNTQDSTAFLTHTDTAVKLAPGIDTFQQYATIANLEQMLSLINTDVDLTQQEDMVNLYYQQALDHARTAIAIAPLHAANYITLAQTYQAIYPYLQADSLDVPNQQILSAYAQALLLQPTNPDYLLALGGFYQSISDLDSALTLYQQALALHPDYLLTNFQLALLYEQKGDTGLAFTYYQNAANLLDSNSPNYQENQALINQRLSALSQ